MSSRAGRPITQARSYAKMMGDPMYHGLPHTCGETLRYTSTGACVRCALAQQEAKRADYRRLREQEALDKFMGDKVDK